MKTIYYIIIAVVVIAIIGYFIYDKQIAKKSTTGAVSAKRINPTTKKVYATKADWVNEKVAWLNLQDQKNSKAWDIQAKADGRGISYGDMAKIDAEYFINKNWDSWELVKP
jgi:hypothetical protein